MLGTFIGSFCWFIFTPKTFFFLFGWLVESMNHSINWFVQNKALIHSGIICYAQLLLVVPSCLENLLNVNYKTKCGRLILDFVHICLWIKTNINSDEVTILNVMDVTSMKTSEYRLVSVLSMFNAVYLLKENDLFLLSILFILILQT